MTYTSFALQVGPTRHHTRIAFYYHIPDTYRQQCALCEIPLSSDDQTMLMTSDMASLPHVVARQQTTATVTAFLNGNPVIGVAHNRCLVAGRWITDKTLRAVYPVFQRAFPYYAYTAQFFNYDSYADHGYARIDSTQRCALFYARNQWLYDREFPHVDPATWIHYTLITAIAKTEYSMPVWQIVVPSSPLDTYIDVVKRYMNKAVKQWDDSVAQCRFWGSLILSTRYPICDYSRIS